MPRLTGITDRQAMIEALAPDNATAQELLTSISGAGCVLLLMYDELGIYDDDIMVIYEKSGGDMGQMLANLVTAYSSSAMRFDLLQVLARAARAQTPPVAPGESQKNNTGQYL